MMSFHLEKYAQLTNEGEEVGRSLARKGNWQPQAQFKDSNFAGSSSTATDVCIIL